MPREDPRLCTVMVGGILLLFAAVAPVSAAEHHVRHNKRLPAYQQDAVHYKLFRSKYSEKGVDVSKTEYNTVEEGQTERKASRFPKLETLWRKVGSQKPYKKKVLTESVTPWWQVPVAPATEDTRLGAFLSDVAGTTDSPLRNINDWENGIDNILLKATAGKEISENQVEGIEVISVPAALPPKNSNFITILTSTHNNKHNHRSPSTPHRPQESTSPPITKTAVKFIYLNDSSELKKMMDATECNLPLPRVVRVDELHPDPSLTYIHSGVLLHRCSKDTGCCPVNQECTPIKTETVEFFIPAYRTVLNKSEKRTARLSFVNHTNCACSNADSKISASSTRGSRQLSVPSQPVHLCPSRFTPRRLADGNFKCDCFHKQKDCIKQLRGSEKLSDEDHQCIANDVCLPVRCLYGDYMMDQQRCVTEDAIFSHWPSKQKKKHN